MLSVILAFSLMQPPPAPPVRTACACGNTCPGTTCKTGGSCQCVTAPTAGQQTYIYRGRSFQFTAATSELANAVRSGIRAVVDGAVPVAMPTAAPVEYRKVCHGNYCTWEPVTK
jgi:hypothetical protein